MIDGSFRENTFGAEYFCKQDFPSNEFEVIWVEFYEKANPTVYKHPAVQVICLNKHPGTTYHSSSCFNEGIKRARGEVIIIPDADVIVTPDFIQKTWDIHQAYEKLVVYGYRYNEVDTNPLQALTFEELRQKCVLTNPTNYGGCLTVRKKWLMAINGYDQTPIFETGFHANGRDMYTRLRNYGLAIQWEPSLRLYHPRHPFTAEQAPAYEKQRKLINWRSKNMEYLPFEGIDPMLNTKANFRLPTS